MGGTQMPTYISLVNLTEQGIKEVKNAPERLRFFDDAAREAGGRLIGFYLVMGQFDYVVITEAPDDQTAARLILGTIAQGSVRTQTMRAFPREEFENMAGSDHCFEVLGRRPATRDDDAALVPLSAECQIQGGWGYE